MVLLQGPKCVVQHWFEKNSFGFDLDITHVACTEPFASFYCIHDEDQLAQDEGRKHNAALFPGFVQNLYNTAFMCALTQQNNTDLHYASTLRRICSPETLKIQSMRTDTL